MTAEIERLPEVEADILEIADWLAADEIDTAYRFLKDVEETISGLAFFPGKGSPKKFRSRILASIRSWAVTGFPNHLILYDFQGNIVTVVAVLRGTRNYSKLLRDRLRGRWTG